MTFHQDLDRGKKVEELILEKYVLPKYPDAYIVDGYCKEWDIFIPSINEGVEVKYDPMSQETGNIVIEIVFNWKPSALLTTKSYRWIFHTGDNVIITSPDRLKNMIDDANLKPSKFTGRGDQHAKLAYLAPKFLVEESALLVEAV